MTERKRVVPLVLVTSLFGFFAWGWLAPAAPISATRQPRAHAAAGGNARARVDAAAVVAAVRHRVAPAGTGHATLEVSDDSYRARFDRDGFRIAAPDTDAEFGVSVARARRGDQAITLKPAPWRAHGNTAVRELASGITERVTARTGAVEWDVVLARPPAGTGDLRVEAAVQGNTAAPIGSTDALRFDLRGGDTARVGEIVVKDAHGKELHRSLPRADRSRLVLDVPAAALASARYPVTIDPVVSTERTIAAPTLPPNSQRSSAVAFDGTNYLVVWSDTRTDDANPDIYGARVSQAGVVLDPNGFAISTAANGQDQPAVAFDGFNYLVVWGDGRSGAADIYAARVSPAGSVLDPSGFAISTATNSQGTPALAFNGNVFLVAWIDFRSGTADIFGARVDSFLPMTVDSVTTGLALSTAASTQSTPDVSFDGTNWLVAWTDFRSGFTDIFGTRVDEFGSALDGAATGLGISTATASQQNPSLTFDGTNYFVAWDDSRGSSNDIFGTRVSPAGSIVDGATTGIAISTAAGNQTTPAVSFDGTNHRVVWADHRGTTNDVYGARVNKAGSVLDAVATGVAVSTAAADQSAPAIASDGTNSLVVWDDTRSPLSASDLFGARVSNGGSVLDGVTRGVAIAVVRAFQSTPSVAFDGTNYLVVWDEARGPSDSQIVAARVSPSGTLLDPAGIDLSVSVLLQKSPDVAFDGTNFLVVWDEFRTPATLDIRGTRVSPAGVVLDPGILNITTLPGATNQETQPALAFDGTNYLVVWSDTRNGLTNLDIFGTRVSPAGTVLDGTATGIPISTAANNQSQPAIAFDGTNYLVTWTDNRSATADIYGTRVSPAGTVIGGAATGIPISTAANAQAESDLAFNGTDYLVAWLDLRSGTSDIFGTRVSTAGSVLDGVASGTPISTAPQEQDGPAVAFNGVFLVTWRDRRSVKNFDLYGARVGSNGAVQDPSGFAVSAKPTNEGGGAVIAGADDTWVSFYSRSESVSGVNQIFSRSIAPK